MKFDLIEIEGAVYQPKKSFDLINLRVIPAAKASGRASWSDFKLLLASERRDKKRNEKDTREADIFVFCYQFLFLRADIYSRYALPENPIVSVEEAESLEKLEQEATGAVTLDFDSIGDWYTNLPGEIHFLDFFKKFSAAYQDEDDSGFRDMIDLYLYTIGSSPKFYNNIFQKISQLQTIFETLIGQPQQITCELCKKNRNSETWAQFIQSKLRELGVTDEEEIRTCIAIKSLLNESRVKYTHYASQLNTWQKTLEELRTGIRHYDGSDPYTTRIADIVEKKLLPEKWSGLDWDNVFRVYQVIVKRMIYMKYLG